MPDMSVSAAMNMNYLFERCNDLVCIDKLDTTNATSRLHVFYDCGNLVQPDSAAQTDLEDSDGANWTNANACP
jgi:hypothetical protein